MTLAESQKAQLSEKCGFSPEQMEGFQAFFSWGITGIHVYLLSDHGRIQP